MKHRSVILGPVVVTTTMQASGAPVSDPATVHDEEGRSWHGRAILLKPWRARTDATVHSRALVLARRR